MLRELASLIAGEIRLNLSTEQQKRLTSAVSVNPEAYEHYLRGRYFWNRCTQDGLKKAGAVEHFEAAIALDPGYARAYAGLADTYAVFPAYGPINFRIAAEKAETAALKALAIDPGISEAYATLRFVTQNK